MTRPPRRNKERPVILDSLHNARFYRAIHPLLAAAFDWLALTRLHDLACGRHMIQGDAIFANVEDYVTRPAAMARWEAHRRYWDVQYLAAGGERIGVAPLTNMVEQVPYDPAADIAWYTGSGDLVTVPQGHFCVLAPHDVHAPGLALSDPAPVRKVVVKLAIS